MKNSYRGVICAFSALLVLAPACARTDVETGAPETAASEAVFIRGGWLFDGVSDTRRRNSGILIVGDTIIAVDFDADSQTPAGATLIELSESETIMPGMFDLHAHYNLDFLDQGRVEEVVHNGTIFLANGVTSTWSAGEYYPERVIAQRDRIDAGEAIGPRLFASGPYFGAFRCEYAIGVAADECIAWPNDITEAEIRAEVDYWASQGVVSLKIKQATPDEARIIIDQAHSHGMTTAGHLVNYEVEYDVTTRDAILMGMDRIEHQLTPSVGGDDPTSADMPEMVELMLEHQVYYDANLQMYGSVNLREDHLDEMVWLDEAQYFTPYTQALLIARGDPEPESDPPEYTQRVAEFMAIYEAGGANLLVVGTDEPVYTSLLPGFAYHRELLAMTYAGLPLVDVLRAATINGATALGVADQLGSIETGKLADIIVVRGNPLEDIKAARDIRFVITSGIVHDPQALLRSATGMIGPTGPDDHADWVLHVRPLRGE
jgi:imidazolonepropionase-like amidohydrolase